MVWKLTVGEHHTVDKTSSSLEWIVIFSRPLGQEQMFLILLNRAKLPSFLRLQRPIRAEKLVCSPPAKLQGSCVLTNSELREKKGLHTEEYPTTAKTTVSV